MVSFYPGPSQINPEIPLFVQQAYENGTTSCNHRSNQFMDLYKATLHTFKKKLNLPSDYTLAFVSSATECWEIITQSYKNLATTHLYNGAFGEKWGQYNQNLGGKPNLLPYALDWTPSQVFDRLESTELICITPTETSNGTQWPVQDLQTLRNTSDTALIAADATASLGGIHLPFELADIWFASVQKCLGLPAGLGILILSPKAIEIAQKQPNTYYNGINNIVKNANKFQTTHTPNVLGIYLLNAVLKSRDNIVKIEKETKAKQKFFDNFLQTIPHLNYACSNPHVLSPTVFALLTKEANTIKEICLQEGMVIGNGYGEWKHNTIRIANFPELKLENFKALAAVLLRILK